MKVYRDAFYKYLAGFEAESRRKRLFTFGFVIALSVGLILRLRLAALAQYPGHGDHAFYYTVAENMVDGRGLQIDYIWNYLSNPEDITHSSHDFWMPLTSIIMSLSMFVFGKSLFAALISTMAAGLFLAVVVYFLAFEYTGSRFISFWSAVLVLFIPQLLAHSLLTDSPIYYALFVSSSLLFMVKGHTNSNCFLLAALFAGLAHLTRQDGVLLFLTLIIVILFSPLRPKFKLSYSFLSVGIYLLVLLPLLVANFRVFGSPFPPGPSKTMFLTQYEDTYTYSKELSLRTYLDKGLPNIIKSKIGGAIVDAKVIYKVFLDSFLKVFVLVGVFELLTSSERRERLRRYFPPIVFFALLFGFYSFVVNISSGAAGFTRSSMSLIPLFVIIAIEGINRNIKKKSVVYLTIAFGLFSSINQSIQFTSGFLIGNARLGVELERLNGVLMKEALARGEEEIVIMTRIPWEVYHSTRNKAIQIPNEGIEVIYEVAQKFGANYLLLPAKNEALQRIYSGEKADARFAFVAKVPDSDLVLYRIILDSDSG